MKTNNPSEKIHRRRLLAVVGSALITGCVQSNDDTNPETQRGELDNNDSNSQQKDLDNNDSDTQEENNDTQKESDENTKEEPEPGEAVVREERKADSPYGDEITPRELTVAYTDRYNMSDIKIRVHDLEEEMEIYYLDISLHGPTGHEGIEVGKPGDYRIEVVVDGEEYEETWVVGRGFTDADVVVSDEGVDIGAAAERGTLVITRVSNRPPGIEPDSYENVSDVEPFVEVFNRLDGCVEDDSPEHCIRPPEDAWEEMEDPDDHQTATLEIQGREFGTVTRYMTEEGNESANLYQQEADEIGYPIGYYVERDGEYYAAIPTSGIASYDTGGPIW